MYKHYVLTGAVVGLFVTIVIPGISTRYDLVMMLYYCSPVILGAVFGFLLECLVSLRMK